jgi:prepilin-type N-terminal cleavage/methylation domain-containing protein
MTRDNLRKRRPFRQTLGNTAGLTLIELMVVIAVLGLLAAIALSEIMTYRRSAIDAKAKSDLRNAATAEEAYFVATGDYLSCADVACRTLPEFRMSSGVSIAMSADNGAQPTFTGTAAANGGGKTFTYSSAAGGMLN